MIKKEDALISGPSYLMSMWKYGRAMRPLRRPEALLEDRVGTPLKLFLHPSPRLRDFPSCPDPLSSLRLLVETELWPRVEETALFVFPVSAGP